jgi:hypothetical protein
MLKMTPSIPILFLIFDLIDLISSVDNDTLLISTIVFDILLIFAPSLLVFIVWFILRMAIYYRGLLRRINTINMPS